MVSNTLHMEQDDLVAALERLRKERGATPEYRKIRRDLPKDWPL
ncbi:MAG TPA: hypothetical protein VNO43_12140 [Candidatus Eisenbacteria bacterium]|nr:hypothetical protein [Candidatus Eisenbacteria bacterium]